MPSLCVCMMVQNAEKTLAIALESLGNVYDELIIVDGGSTDSTCEIALNYGAKLIHSKWPGNHSQQRNVYLKSVNTDWIFVIDSDEFIDKKTLDYLRFFKYQTTLLKDTDNFWLPRKWVSSANKNYYIKNSPHYPDFKSRLINYNKHIYYSGLIHKSVHGLVQADIRLINLTIAHLILLINSEEKRSKKVIKYSTY